MQRFSSKKLPATKCHKLQWTNPPFLDVFSHWYPPLKEGFSLCQWEFQDPKMEQNGGTVPYKAIFWGDIPLHRPYIGLIYGRYLHFRILKFPLTLSRLIAEGYTLYTSVYTNWRSTFPGGSKGFFSPSTDRSALPRLTPATNVGYGAVGNEALNARRAGDIKEAFNLRKETLTASWCHQTGK